MSHSQAAKLSCEWEKRTAVVLRTDDGCCKDSVGRENELRSYRSPGDCVLRIAGGEKQQPTEPTESMDCLGVDSPVSMNEHVKITWEEDVSPALNPVWNV